MEGLFSACAGCQCYYKQMAFQTKVWESAGFGGLEFFDCRNAIGNTSGSMVEAIHTNFHANYSGKRKACGDAFVKKHAWYSFIFIYNFKNRPGNKIQVGFFESYFSGGYFPASLKRFSTPPLPEFLEQSSTHGLFPVNKGKTKPVKKTIPLEVILGCVPNEIIYL
jgi:hypothetical protein